MKISKLKVLLASSLVVLGLGITSVVKVSAIQYPDKYYDPKYYTDPIPTNYYQSVDTSKTGKEFRDTLEIDIKRGYKKHGYSDNTTVLKYTDPDPQKPGSIICLYTGLSFPNSGSSGDKVWNKEHVWAKSHGFPKESYAPYCDAHHLRPTQASINSSRGNLDFGELPNGRPDQYGNKVGDVFEPRDEVKGDVARMMFYMETRYGNEFGLELVTARITNRSDGNGRFGGLNDLIKWHYEDPVSKEEVYRNNVIYEEFQHNRNPYIDHPEWVALSHPNDYDSAEPDKAKVQNVINLINKLPDVITLDDEGRITNCKFEYNKLNAKEKALVTNYDKLLQAIDALNALKPNPEPEPNPEPDTPSNPTNKDNIQVDFTDSGLNKTSGYEKSVTATINNNKYLFSDLYVLGSDVRLGAKKGLSSLNSFGISGSGAYIEPQFVTNNLKSFSINISNTFGTIDEWQILFKEENSSNYEPIAKKTKPGSSFLATASLDTPRNGNFAFVIKGSGPRAVLDKMEMTVEVKEVLKHPFEDVTLEATAFSSGNKKYIRFGINAPISIYEGETETGIFVVSTNSLRNKTVKEIYDGLKSKDFYTLLDALFNYKATYFDFKAPGQRAIVDENGNLKTDGAIYQYGAVINDVLGHENYSFTAVAYLEVNGIVYFTNEVSGTYNTFSV